MYRSALLDVEICDRPPSEIWGRAHAEFASQIVVDFGPSKDLVEVTRDRRKMMQQKSSQRSKVTNEEGLSMPFSRLVDKLSTRLPPFVYIVRPKWL